MSNLVHLIEAWDEGHREFAISLGDFPAEDLWKRPHPRLLSVGELCGHIAYAQGIWALGDGNYRPDLEKLPIQSPLIHNNFSYYLTNVEDPYIVDMSPPQILEEVMRIHEAAKAVLNDKEFSDPYPGQWGTWGYFLQYQVFHIAYHTGQIYSVRHLLGHETEDN